MEKLKENELTQELLKECFTYKDGGLYWRHRPDNHFNNDGDSSRFNTPNSGKLAGYFNKRSDSNRKDFGYWKIRITYKGRQGIFRRNRLTYLYHHGVLPEKVDHKDNDSSNDHIDNLRESNSSDNGCNSYVSGKGSSKYKGVSFKKARNKWYAQLEFRGVVYGCGSHESEIYAAIAYNTLARLLNPDHFLLNPVEGSLGLEYYPPNTITKLEAYFNGNV